MLVLRSNKKKFMFLYENITNKMIVGLLRVLEETCILEQKHETWHTYKTSPADYL